MTIHENTDDLYTYKQCREELLETEEITKDTPKDEVVELIHDKGFNDCDNCKKYTGTINLNWDCDYILKEGYSAVCDECQHLVIEPIED